MNNEKTGYPSIDRPWMKYYTLESDTLVLPKKSIYELAYDENKDNLKNIAIDLRSSKNDFKKGITITYNNFFKKIKNMAHASKVLGINKNEIVPLILPNVPEARTFIYSNSYIGATSYPISPMLPSNTLEKIIKENNIKNVVIFSAFFEKYKNVLNECNLNSLILLDGTESLPNSLQFLNKIKTRLSKSTNGILNNNVINYQEYYRLKNLLDDDIQPYYEKDHVAAIIGTSGTTGTSKGVVLTDDNINAAALEYKLGECFQGKFLDALLPSIGYGISMMHYQIVNKHYTYLVPELVTDRIADLIQATKPDTFPGGPVHYINLLQSDEFKNGTLHHAKNYISGGASLPHDVEMKLNGVGDGYSESEVNDNLYVRQGFGLSENVATGSYSKRGSYKFGSIGIPLPYSKIGVFEPGTDKELKYNEPGEICISGPTVMKEYLNNKEETDKVIKIHGDGQRWIHTKDIGYIDEDGHIFHMERIKNIFMRTGFNVHPSKIAEFINSIDYVKNSYVIGFEHPIEQCVPVAFIQLNDNSKKEEALSYIKNKCFSNLEETSIPYEYVFVDELPINVGGKIDGIRLKKESNIDYMKRDNVKSLKLKK